MYSTRQSSSIVKVMSSTGIINRRQARRDSFFPMAKQEDLIEGVAKYGHFVSQIWSWLDESSRAVMGLSPRLE
jgi:hypothetical protein